MTEDERERLEEILGCRFRQPAWLEKALTHRSCRDGSEGAPVYDNESLEFLGDRVLGLAVSDGLVRQFPEWDAGTLAKTHSRLVSASSVSAAASRLGLGSFLRLGRGEEKTGGREKRRLLADCYEAVTGAIYRDAGYEAAASFVTRTLLLPVRETHSGFLRESDYKSALQEWVQQRALGRVEYRVSRELGPDHKKVFEVEAWLGGRRLAFSEGGSKKEAEQSAAQLALERLRNPDDRE